MSRLKTAGDFFLTKPAATRILLLVSIVGMALHLAVATRYGYLSDELYFRACAIRLDFGYADQPPLIAWITALIHLINGLDSLLYLRIVAALLHILTIVLGTALAQALGAGILAQGLTSVSILLAPGFLLLGTVLVIPSLEPPIWTAIFLSIVLIINRTKSNLEVPLYRWALLGILIGLGILAKYSIALPLMGLLIGALLFRRDLLFSRGMMIALGSAGLVFLPNLIWLSQNDWITIRFLGEVKKSGWVSQIGIFEMVSAQFLYPQPINGIIALLGGFALLKSQALKPYRVLGMIYPLVFGILITVGSKLYYTLPMFPLLIAAGWTILERSKKVALPLATAMTLSGILYLPAGVPLLTLAEFENYMNRFTFGLINPDIAPEAFNGFYDMDGQSRREIIRDLEKILGGPIQSKPLSSGLGLRPRKILAENYTIASGIEFEFEGKTGLPLVISPNVTYYLWGPGDGDLDGILSVGYSREELLKYFDGVDRVSNYFYYVSRPKFSTEDIWRSLQTLAAY